MIVAVMVVIDALAIPAALVWREVDPDSFFLVALEDGSGIQGIAFLVKILTMIIFSVWIYRAGANLLAAGFEDLEFTPGARIWWFAVPIACLFKPFQGMRELWNASHRQDYADNHSLITSWWLLWLATNFFGSFSSIGASPEGPSLEILWIGSGLDAVAAVVAIVMIRGIASAQTQLTAEALDEVFA
ncbi:DUF4328 domain-containing protein [Sphingomonas sp. LB-2]|nr:DUF4328 domain-containing protein [Sphingomonas caeni]